MSFYQQSTISLYSWFLLVFSCNISPMTFHGSIFLNIKLGPTTTSSPRRRGRGLHNPDSSHDQIRCFWLAEVRNFTKHHDRIDHTRSDNWPLGRSHYRQCLKLSQKSCRSSCLEFQIINTKLKKNQQKFPSPPPKLSASDRRTYGNFQHWLPGLVFYLWLSKF